MANVLKGRMWYVDTTGEIIATPVKILSIQWVGTSGSEIADNDVCNISETSGSTPYFYRMATAATESLEWYTGGDGIWVDGVYVNTLGHGALLIEIA